MTNYQVTLTRGQHGHESILVRGSLEAWLKEHKARPTKDPDRFIVGGWRCVVAPVSDDAVKLVEAIMGKEYPAP